MHRGGLANPLDPIAQQMRKISQKRDKTEADLEELARLEWYGGLCTEQGKPCIPGEVVEATFIVAAKKKKRGRQAQAGVLCPSNYPLIYEGPTELEALWQDPTFRLTTGVRVQRNRVMRTCPRFWPWGCMIEIHYDPRLLNEREILDILMLAGEEVGFCDWRPKFGRFRVEVSK